MDKLYRHHPRRTPLSWRGSLSCRPTRKLLGGSERNESKVTLFRSFPPNRTAIFAPLRWREVGCFCDTRNQRGI